MKKNISINLQGIIFHIEDDGYEVLSRYLAEVKAHFASYQGHEEIVADIEGRIAELFAARITPSKQVITLDDVEEMTAKMGRVSDFNASPDEDDEPAYATGAGSAASSQSANFGRGYGSAVPPAGAPLGDDGQPRRLYRDMAHRKIAGVAAGLAQYFLINPLWVRLGFLALLLLPNSFALFINGPLRHNFGPGTIAFIAYVVLWIALPKRYDAPEPIDTLSDTGPLAGRRLYRNTDAGKVGGVSAGLAAYFNVDVTLIRVAFLALVFAGGSGLVIYVILWIVVPEARTVSEKMQMRGDAVTLSNIDSNLRTGALDGDAGSRPVGTFFENAAREARPAFGFVGRVLRILVGAFILFVAGSLLVALAMALGTVLGLFPHDTVELGNNSTKYLLLHDVPTWGTVSAFLALGIPALALLLLGVRLLLRRPVLNQTGSLLLLGLWLVGIVGTTAAVAQYAREYRSHATYTTSRPLNAVPGPGLVLAVRDQDRDDVLSDIDLRLAPADSSAPGSVEEEYSARGRSQSAARLTAERTILYHYAQKDSTLTLDRGITLRESAPYRNQRLTLTLHLPLSKVYTLTPRFLEQLGDDDFTNRRRPDDDESHRARLTRQGRFVLLDNAGNDDNDVEDSNFNSSDDSDNEGDSDDEVVKFDVNGNRMRVRVNTDGDEPRISVESEAVHFNTDPGHYGSGRKALSDAGEFEEIEAYGAIRVVIRPGDTYTAEAAGRPEDLRRLRLDRDGDQLKLRQRDTEFNLFSLGRNENHAVLVTITMPRRPRSLALHGACQADLNGFDQGDDLHLEASGASSARVAANVTNLTVDLSGASRADLTGSAQRLTIDGSGTCQVEALGFTSVNTKVELNGVSKANVRASESLDVDLSGSSHVRYAGQPRISQDLNGASSLEQVRD